MAEWLNGWMAEWLHTESTWYIYVTRRQRHRHLLIFYLFLGFWSIVLRRSAYFYVYRLCPIPPDLHTIGQLRLSPWQLWYFSYWWDKKIGFSYWCGHDFHTPKKHVGEVLGSLQKWVWSMSRLFHIWGAFKTYAHVNLLKIMVFAGYRIMMILPKVGLIFLYALWRKVRHGNISD